MTLRLFFKQQGHSLFDLQAPFALFGSDVDDRSVDSAAARLFGTPARTVPSTSSSPL